MGFKDKIFGGKKKKDRLTLIDMQAKQSGCIYKGKDCEFQFTLYNRKWCGLDSRHNFNCPKRREPEIPA